MGTSQGLYVRNLDESWTIYTSKNSGLIHDSVISLIIDELDRILIGTGEGLSILRPDGTWASYLPDIGEGPAQQRNNVLDLAFDNQGYLWLYTSTGLSKFDESASTSRSVLQPYKEASSTLMVVRNLTATTFVILLVAHEILYRRASIKRFIIEQTPGIVLMSWSIFSIALVELLVSDLGSFLLVFYPGVSLVLWLGAGFRWPKKTIYTALLGILGYGFSLLYLWIRFSEEPFDPLSAVGMWLITYGYGAMGVICFLSVNLGAAVAKWNIGKDRDQTEKTEQPLNRPF